MGAVLRGRGAEPGRNCSVRLGKDVLFVSHTGPKAHDEKALYESLPDEIAALGILENTDDSQKAACMTIHKAIGHATDRQPACAVFDEPCMLDPVSIACVLHELLLSYILSNATVST